jgi:hypothetical protein
MTLLAAIRPDDWNLPLFLHILGAMVLMGALVLVAASLAGAARGAGSAPAVRLGFRSLLVAAIPAWIVLRVTAEWLVSEQNLDEETPGWVDVGYMVSDTSLLLLIAATVCAGIAARRADRGEMRGGGLSRAVIVLVAIALVAYVVAIWAMATKPS